MGRTCDVLVVNFEGNEVFGYVALLRRVCLVRGIVFGLAANLDSVVVHWKLVEFDRRFNVR